MFYIDFCRKTFCIYGDSNIEISKTIFNEYVDLTLNL